MVYILHNPKAGSGRLPVDDARVMAHFPDTETAYEVKSVMDIPSYPDFFDGLQPKDAVVLAGGDGTLNYLANAMADRSIRQRVYLYKAGTGNDFLHDIFGHRAPEDTLLDVSEYVTNLPTVSVKGKLYRFLNNVSFGIDGWVCGRARDERARREKRGEKPANYTWLALKGLLGLFHCSNAEVTVDGVTRRYRKVWLAPAMNGRYFGGGMMIAPHQDRKTDRLTSVVFFGTNRLRTLLLFPSIFKGGHLRYKKNIAVLTGKEITVTFDRPQDLQIDGELVRGVTTFTARKTAAPLCAAR